MRKFGFYTCIAITILATACSSPEPVAPRLVVDGWIENGEHPRVLLTVPYHPGEESTHPEDLLAHPAMVTISDGENKWQLYGRTDHDFFPPYIYTNPMLEGEIGKEYTLVAEYDGLRASATTKILPPPRVMKLEVTVSTTDKERRSVMLSVEANPDSTEYFNIYVQSLGVDKRTLPAFMGTFATHPGDGVVTLPVMRPKNHVDTLKYAPEYYPGERLEIKLCRMEESAYKFWMDYQNAISFGGGNMISSSYPMRGNVEGGLGIFAGYGAFTRILEIK